MHVFIDESGSFSGFSEGSLGVEGALSIPDTTLPKITAKYARIRDKLPKISGEVKGKLLSESEVASVVSLLARYHVIFEATVIDVGTHTHPRVTAYKTALARMMEERLPKIQRGGSGGSSEDHRSDFRKTSVPLFLQAATTFDVLQSVIRHVPLFFAQRQPRELGSFAWIVDGKEPAKVNRIGNLVALACLRRVIGALA